MKLDHVGIVVGSIEEALPFYREQLGLVVICREDVPSQKVKVAVLASSKESTGALIELIEPASPDGSVANFLKSRGPGLHHIAFHAEGLERAMGRLKAAGRPPLDDRPRPGARGLKGCFIHPKHTQGVLVELVEEDDSRRAGP